MNSNLTRQDKINKVGWFIEHRLMINLIKSGARINDFSIFGGSRIIKLKDVEDYLTDKNISLEVILPEYKGWEKFKRNWLWSEDKVQKEIYNFKFEELLNRVQ